MNKLLLSIIIVNWNTKELLKKCLNSIFNTVPEKFDFEIIVVDNASSDESVKIIKRDFPQVKLITNNKNLGFAKANNQALNVAKGDFLLLLNPDTVILDNAIDRMVKIIENDPDIDILGCQILNPDKSIQPSAGQFPTIFNLVLNRTPLFNKLLKSYFINKKSYYQKEQSPDWLMAACLMVRRKVTDAIGLFDEQFFMYGEDVDFCYRARSKKYQIKFIPEAKIIHHDLGKTAANKLNKFTNLRKGLLIFFQKHYSKKQLWLLKFLLRIELALK